jgi:hypothetical protein
VHGRLSPRSASRSHLRFDEPIKVLEPNNQARGLASGSISSLSSFESRSALLERIESPLCRGSHCLYACGFRIYFTPLPGFFSPFPHGTGSLSVDDEYLALEDGPPIFRQDFTCPALLLATPVPHLDFRVRGYHPLRPAFPDRSTNRDAKDCRLVPFRSPLLWESRLISVPLAT